MAKIEKSSTPVQSDVINIINTYETLLAVPQEPRTRTFRRQLLQGAPSFHTLWKGTATREKPNLLAQCAHYISPRTRENDGKVDIGQAIEHNRRAFRELDVPLEEWLELGQVTAYVSMQRALAQSLDYISQEHISSQLYTVSEGKDNKGYYVRPRIEVFSHRVASDPLVQAIDNLIANGFDAINPDAPIGMFASGIKSLLVFLEQGKGEIRVVTKHAEDETLLLRLRKSLGNRYYLNVIPLSEYPFGDIPDLSSKTGTRVVLHGIELNQNRIDHALENLSFKSGDLNGVTVNISEQKEKKVKTKRFGAPNRNTTRRGTVRVVTKPKQISVTDTGCGMKRDQLYKMFLPRQGSKEITLAAPSEVSAIIHEWCYLETKEVPNQTPRLILKRRGEILKKVYINEAHAGVFEGDLVCEMDILARPAGEARGQGEIYIDANFKTACNEMIQLVLNSSEPNESKLRIINSFVLGLKGISNHQENFSDSATEQNRIINETVQDIAISCREMLRKLEYNYQLIPTERVFQRIQSPSFKPLLPVDRHILLRLNNFALYSLGEHLNASDGLRLKDYEAYSVNLITPALSGKNPLDLAYTRGAIESGRAAELLPVIIDADFKYVIIDCDWWGKFKKLRQAFEDDPENTKKKYEYYTAQQALTFLISKRINTNYELPDVHNRDATEIVAPHPKKKKNTQNRTLELSNSARPLLNDVLNSMVEEPPLSQKLIASLHGFIAGSTIFPEWESNGTDHAWDLEIDGTRGILLQADYALWFTPYTDRLHKPIRLGNYRMYNSQPPTIIHSSRGVHILDFEDYSSIIKEVVIGHLNEPLTEYTYKISVNGDESRLSMMHSSFFTLDSSIYLLIGHSMKDTVEHRLIVYKLDDTKKEFIELNRLDIPHTVCDVAVSVVGGNAIVTSSVWDTNATTAMEEILVSPLGKFRQLHDKGLRRNETLINEMVPVVINGKNYVLAQMGRNKMALAPVSASGVGDFVPLFTIEKDVFRPFVHVRNNELTISDLRNSNAAWSVTIDSRGCPSSVRICSPFDLDDTYATFHGSPTLLFISPVDSSYWVFCHSFTMYNAVVTSNTEIELLAGDNYTERVRLANRVIAAFAHPSLASLEETAGQELLHFCLDSDLEDTEANIRALEAVLRHPLFSYLNSSELKHALSRASKENRYWQNRFMNFAYVLRTGTNAAIKKSHLEVAIICYVYDQENFEAFCAMIDGLELEKMMPLAEDRTNALAVLRTLTRVEGRGDQDTVKLISQVGRKCSQLKKMNLLTMVIDRLHRGMEGKYAPLEALSDEEQSYVNYLTSDVDIIRQEKKPLHLVFNRTIDVAGIAYLRRVLGFTTLDQMDSAAQKSKQTLEDVINRIPNLSEFQRDWQIAVYFSGVNGVEQRELVQNAHDAILRRQATVGDIQTGFIAYDFYLQEINNQNYFIQSVKDNGSGLDDTARIAFAVSGVSDKDGTANQSGEFGIGFASNYKDIDMVILDTVRIVDPQTMQRGAAQDIYVVERNARGYAQRLILVSSSSDNTITQDVSLGTTIKLCKRVGRSIPELDAITGKNTARKFAWLTKVTSSESTMTQLQPIPIEILCRENYKGRWQYMKQKISHTPFGSFALDKRRQVTLYSGDRNLLPHLALDGRWVQELSETSLSLVHPALRQLIKTDSLIFNVHGFTPTRDRGALIDGDDIPYAISALLTKYASHKALTDTKYQPEGMPIDFRINPDYTDSLMWINPLTQDRIRAINQRGEFGFDDAVWLREQPLDVLNILLVAYEHQGASGRTSILGERISSFQNAYKELVAHNGSRRGREYIEDIERCKMLSTRLCSDAMQQRIIEMNLPAWITWAKKYISLYEGMRNVSIAQIVTAEHNTTERYAAVRKLMSVFDLDDLEIVRNTPLGGLTLPRGMRISEQTFVEDNWYEVVIHETAHHIEELLNRLGQGSMFTHQQDSSFALAMRLSSWVYLRHILQIK